MIDVQTGKYSSASELSKAKASAKRRPCTSLQLTLRVAYLKLITKLYMQLEQKNYICCLIEGCPEKGKFTLVVLKIL